MKSCILVFTVLAALCFTGCGGTSMTSTTTTTQSTFTIGGTVSGLTGTVVLQNNLGNNLSISASGSFTFSTPIASGSAYSVTVLTQPVGQMCSVSNGSGTATASVNNVAVTCATASPGPFTLSVAVTGLASGATLEMQDDVGNDLAFTSDTTLTFASTYVGGASYTVSVFAQPTGQTCTLSSNASGTITSNITVTATCSTTTSPTYTLSVMVTGLSGGSLVLEDSQDDELTFTTSTNSTQTFATPYASGAQYSISGLMQPTGETCSLSSNYTGTITSNTTVTATCAPVGGALTISAEVTGLASGTSLVIEDSATDQLTFTSNSLPQTFATQYVSGQAYNVTIVTQPSGQTCTPTSYTGSITSSLQLTFTCVAATTFTISAEVTGLATGTVLLMQASATDQLTFKSNSTLQTFATKYTSGEAYAITIVTQPTGQTCTLSSNASGNITSNITVTATCTTNIVNYTISAAVTGLTGTLKLADDKGDALTFTTNTTQTFATSYPSGSSYTVSITSQPAGQTCTLGSNASGTITSNITVTATCTTTPVNYTISVKTTGLSGTLKVADDKGDALTFTTNTTQTFATSYASGSSYTVSITSQPTGQTCTLGSNASGTITSDITVTATCTSGSGLTVSVSVSGLSGTVTMQDDQGDTLTFSSDGTQTFSNSYASGASYTVAVSSQPSAQACIPTYSTGTITSDVTIAATCATGSTRQLGTISGVSSVSCSGSIKNGVCQQMTVSCPSVPDVFAFVKTNTPTGTSLGTATYNTGTDGNGLYENIFTYGGTAVGNVLDAGFTTVQISWGTPFNDNQPNGWVEGPGGVLASACRYATVTNWIYNNIQNDKSLPYCATANSGGAGALAYALSQYGSNKILSMAEVTSGPPTARLDWGCGCQEGKLAVQCGSSSTLGTCFGTADAPVWDPAYNPNETPGVCTDADDAPPPVGLDFLGDSVEAPGATYNFPSTNVNLVFGGADDSSAIPIGQDWFNNITSTKGQACVAGGVHSLADTLAGAQQIANDLINLCKLQ